MKMKTISLGVERPDYGSELAAHEPEKPRKMKTSYPSFYISDLKESMDIPDSGEATIKFKVVERRENERDGKCLCSYDLEVQEISFVGKASSPKEESADDAVEKGLAEAESKKATKGKEDKKS